MYLHLHLHLYLSIVLNAWLVMERLYKDLIMWISAKKACSEINKCILSVSLPYPLTHRHTYIIGLKVVMMIAMVLEVLAVMVSMMIVMVNTLSVMLVLVIWC